MHPMRERERECGRDKDRGEGREGGRGTFGSREDDDIIQSSGSVEIQIESAGERDGEREAGRRRSKERDAVSLFSLIQSSLNVNLSFYSSTAFGVNFVNFLSIPFGTVQVCFFTLSCDTEKLK